MEPGPRPAHSPILRGESLRLGSCPGYCPSPLKDGVVSDPTFAALTRSLVLLLTSKGLVNADPSRNGLGLNNALYISMLLEVFRQRTSRPNLAGQLLLIEVALEILLLCLGELAARARDHRARRRGVVARENHDVLQRGK